MGSDALLPISRHRAGGNDASKMKVRLAALFGFFFGFAMAFVTLISYGNSVSEVLSERPTTLVITTGEGSSFGSSSSGVAAQSGPDLYHEVRVVCMVLTYSANRHRAIDINATWGKRCNRLILMSDEDNPDIGAVNIGGENSHENLWTKTRKSFRYVYENLLNEGDWFLKADDDTYIVMENLRYMLYGYNAQTPIYFGHKFAYEDNIYMSGGGGYVLSKESLRRFIVDAYDNETLCLGDEPNSEDLQMGECLTNVGVLAGNSMDMTDGTQRFHPLKLGDYIQSTEWLPDWIYNRSVDPIKTGMLCCSEYIISFHYLDSVDMYVYDTLLYRMRVHGLEKSFRTLPDKVPLELG